MKLRLDFENASAILETTMTDNFNYQDVIQTNIPELERNIGLHATYLLSDAQNSEFYDPEKRQYRSTLNTSEITQAVWKLLEPEKIPDSDEKRRVQSSLAITVMKDYFCVGIMRQLTPADPVYRQSTHTYAYGSSSIVRLDGHYDRDSEQHGESFQDVFYKTVAVFGLKDRLAHIFEAQNESSEAIFANAA